jgi:exonuclease III
LAKWIKKEDPTICCLQETHLIYRNKHWLRVKDWKKIYQVNGLQKQAGQSRFQTYIDQTRYRRTFHTNRRGNTLKYYVNSKTVVVGDFNTPLSPVDGSSKQKNNNEILDLNQTIDQMYLDDVYRIFHPTSAQYTFF